MHFLNFLTSHSQLLNFNLQGLTPSSCSKHQNQASKMNSGSEGSSLKTAAQIRQQMETMSNQQQIINQYMNINIQLLNKKLQDFQKNPTQNHKNPSNQKQEESEQSKNTIAKKKKIVKCGHHNKQHYAKGMCSNCYHKFGRKKKPWKCTHQILYAGGMCQNCYINNYNKSRRMTKSKKQQQQRVDSESPQESQQQKQGLIDQKNEQVSQIKSDGLNIQ